jgi:hypothetical protein
LTKAKLDVEEKKKKHCIEHSTAANPPPKAHARKPNGGGYAAVQTFATIFYIYINKNSLSARELE